MTKAFCAVKPGEGVLIRNLQAGQCKWPLGKVKDVSKRFCGVATGDTQTPYCICHKAIAYQPSENKRKIAAPYDPTIRRVALPREEIA